MTRTTSTLKQSILIGCLHLLITCDANSHSSMPEDISLANVSRSTDAIEYNN